MMIHSLSAIYAHQNLAFIGPAGTGKTHLAQAFGYACCQQGLKTYFIKATELRDRFSTAIRNGKTDSCLMGLVRPSCLIIDEIGHCSFDKNSTRLFFERDILMTRTQKIISFSLTLELDNLVLPEKHIKTKLVYSRLKSKNSLHNYVSF